MNRSVHFALCALASTVLVLAGTPAHAALGGDSGIVIPYAGKLELNGALVTGTVVFRFEVLESSAPPTVCQTKEIPDVLVTNGEFAVTISGVSEACVKGKDVHLQIAVKQGLDSFVVLGKQRVTPVLGAVTSGPGDFAVTGAMTAKSLVVSDPQSALVADFNGLAIGTDTIKAAGSATNQDIILVPKGSGIVELTGSLRVAGDLNVTNGLPITVTNEATLLVFNGDAQSRVLRESQRSVCFLTMAKVRDTMANQSQVECHVQSRDGFWILSASTVTGSGDPDVECGARCIVW